MHRFLISGKLSGFFPFLFFFSNFTVELGSWTLYSTYDNMSLLGGTEWLHCLFMPILGPEGKDKTVLRLDDGSIGGHS